MSDKQSKWAMSEDDFGMPEEGIFADITGDRRALLLQAIAYMAEKAYRRGFQQGHWASENEENIVDLADWRFCHTLHESLDPHNGGADFALNRLSIECGGELYSMFGEHPIDAEMRRKPRNRQQFG